MGNSASSTSFSSTFMSWLARHRVFISGYALAAASVAAAFLITSRIQPLLGESISPLFFAAVMICAWYGGMGPGLLATVLAGYCSAFYFANPPLRPGFGWDDAIRLGVFLMVALLISWLTWLRKRADTALRASFEQLEIRIDQRTAELRGANAALRESEERFRLLVAGVADYAIVMLDVPGNVVSWNSGAQRILGYDEGAIVNRSAALFLPGYGAGDAPRILAQNLRAATEQGRHEDEGSRVRADGTRFWANVITTALRDDTGSPRGFAQVTRDVTDVRRLEREVLEISEREQMRIGHDLHDVVGQELTGLALLSQNLAQKLSARHLPESADAERLVTLLNQALQHTRDLARGFSPIELGPEGLATALRDLASQVQRASSVHCVSSMVNDVRISDDTAALHLYRIAQEALNNAVRHARATEINISLAKINSAIELVVSDNGIGMQQPDQVAAGMGINGMQYRARLIGATWEIRTGDIKTGDIKTGRDGGVTICCTYPVSSEQDQNNVEKSSQFSQTASHPAGR